VGDEKMNILATYGTPLKLTPTTRKIPLPLEKLYTMTAPKGALYEIKLTTSPLTPDKATEAIEKLKTEMQTRFGINLIYASATENSINLTIQGSPFTWAALIAFLPTILLGIGIILLAISAWQITTAIPSWVWFLLITGGVLIFFGPAIGETILKQIEKARLPPPPPPS
jgi:hypothetical protein